MTDIIVIRELKTMPELDATVELQRAVWGMRDVEVASPHTLRAIVHSGGAVFGALLEGALVGFCFGFAARREGELWLWSHMAAAHPDFQGRGIGFRLKQAQRKWALAQGFRWMAWTFDPLQAGNANFNFNRLGVTARHYSADHYGEMQDGLNAGLASDRLEAQWELAAPHVLELARNRLHGGGATPFEMPGVTKLVYVDAIGELRREQLGATGIAAYGIEIPVNIAKLKQLDIERAKQWQLHLREAMIDLLAAGYIVSGFARTGDRGIYILSQPHPPSYFPSKLLTTGQFISQKNIVTNSVFYCALSGDPLGRPCLRCGRHYPSPPGPLSHKGRGGATRGETQGILRVPRHVSRVCLQFSPYKMPVMATLLLL